jgi:signal transduction histidine kinase
MEDLLSIGKASAGRMEFSPATLNLEAFCQEVIDEISVTTGDKHALVFECQRICQSGKCSLFEMDRKIVRTILINLLSNAVKYSPQGGTVRLNLVLQDSQAIFQVQDSGIGIPEKDKQHLFEAFHRASNVGNISGTGLGLAIIKQAVELHGGSITCESKLGVGTTFTVCLPTHQPNDL